MLRCGETPPPQGCREIHSPTNPLFPRITGAIELLRLTKTLLWITYVLCCK